MILKKTEKLSWAKASNGIELFFKNEKDWQKAKNVTGDIDLQMAYVQLQMILESDEFQASRTRNGVLIKYPNAVKLDNTIRNLFNLPSEWLGEFSLETYGGSVDWKGWGAKLILVEYFHGKTEHLHWKLNGNLLDVGG